MTPWHSTLPRPLRTSPRALAWVAALLGAVAATSSAAEVPDWTALADERVPVIVTRNEDGSLRETKLWIAVVDGHAYFRTGNSRWFRNIERNPEVELRIAGASYPLRAERLRDAELERRVAQAMRTKYGFWDRVISPFRGSDPNVMRLVPRR